MLLVVLNIQTRAAMRPQAVQDVVVQQKMLNKIMMVLQDAVIIGVFNF